MHLFQLVLHSVINNKIYVQIFSTLSSSKLLQVELKPKVTHSPPSFSVSLHPLHVFPSSVYWFCGFSLFNCPLVFVLNNQLLKTAPMPQIKHNPQQIKSAMEKVKAGVTLSKYPFMITAGFVRILKTLEFQESDFKPLKVYLNFVFSPWKSLIFFYWTRSKIQWNQMFRKARHNALEMR